MRVFILCTGRNGSVTFIKACQQISNYSSGHETLSKELGEKRFNYPDNHIEADNRLSWFLGTLDKKFNDSEFYVHLKRNKQDTVTSLNKRLNSREDIVRAFCEGVLKTPFEKVHSSNNIVVCEDYYNTVTNNIDHFLKDKSNKMTIELENIKEGFSEFWTKIGAKGNLESALNELNVKHNKSNTNKNYLYKLKLLFLRIKKSILKL